MLDRGGNRMRMRKTGSLASQADCPIFKKTGRVKIDKNNVYAIEKHGE